MIRSKTDTPVFQLSGLPGKNMLNLYSCTQKCGLALRECKMYVKCKPLHGEFAPVQTVFFTIIYMYKRTLLFTLLLASLQITKQTSKSVISTLFFFQASCTRISLEAYPEKRPAYSGGKRCIRKQIKRTRFRSYYFANNNCEAHHVRLVNAIIFWFW